MAKNYNAGFYQINIFRTPSEMRRNYNKAIMFFGFVKNDGKPDFTGSMKYWMREIYALYLKERENGERNCVPRLCAGNIPNANTR
jgi:hypothetical protein